MLCTSSDVILELIMQSESHCDSLWVAWVAILDLFWKVGKMTLQKRSKEFLALRAGDPAVP